jgi:tetratricopeptide (TPR) repeat protein
MKSAPLALLLLVGLATASAEAQDVRSLFESGKYEQVVESVSGAEDADPMALYLAALSQQKLSNDAGAGELFSRLASRPETDPWRFIGESGRHILDGQAQPALAAANRAVAVDSGLPFAHYQLGLAYGRTGDFPRSAAAFNKATQLDPGFAYAHYHAGVAYSKAKRVDLMAAHFESFLKLAPEAPERAEVESIMRTLRGR